MDANYNVMFRIHIYLHYFLNVANTNKGGSILSTILKIKDILYKFEVRGPT